MKNLQLFNTQELSVFEMEETNGGFLITLAIACGIAFITGVGIGVALYAATE